MIFSSPEEEDVNGVLPIFLTPNNLKYKILIKVCLFIILLFNLLFI